MRCLDSIDSIDQDEEQQEMSKMRWMVRSVTHSERIAGSMS